MNQLCLRWRIILWFVLGMLGGGVLSANVWAQPTPPPFEPAAVPTPSAPPITAFAAGSFAQNCAPCHGPTGNSDGETTASLPAPPPPFADPATVWERSPAEYFHTTKFGRIQNLMPPWNNQLNDEQIWQAVYYAWSLHTDQARVARGAELYAQSCAACHGPQGTGDGPEASGPLPNFADSATMLVQSPAALDSGWQQAHAEQGQEWSAEDRRAVLDYIRTFSYSPPWISGYQPGDGLVTGQVVQGTTDGGSVASLPITLTAFVNFEPAATFTTTTDADGAF